MNRPESTAVSFATNGTGQVVISEAEFNWVQLQGSITEACEALEGCPPRLFDYMGS